MDFYHGTDQAYWDADNVIRERRRKPLPQPRVAPAFLDLMKAALVAMVILTVLFVDRLGSDEQVMVALAYFFWAGLYASVKVGERVR